MKSFEVQVNEYEQTLTRFVVDHDLPREWFTHPDHVAFKGRDTADYEALVRQFRPHSEQISWIEMGGRRLASAYLTGSISVGAFGEVHWVEIMEPRPEKVGKDVIGFEHMEFYYPHFDRVIPVLHQKRIDYERQSNPSHSWINVVLNDSGQELKLNDGRLADIVAHELDTGEAKILR